MLFFRTRAKCGRQQLNACAVSGRGRVLVYPSHQRYVTIKRFFIQVTSE